MKPLFTLFWQICRFRQGPENVPYAPALAGLLVLAVAALSGLSVVLLNVMASGTDMDTPNGPRLGALEQAVVQWVTLLAWIGVIALLLLFKSVSTRFVQTLAALMGTDIIMAVPQLFGFMLLVSQPRESALALIAEFAVLFVYVWDMLIKGHIYACAMNVSRMQGNLLSLALSFGTFALSSVLAPILF